MIILYVPRGDVFEQIVRGALAEIASAENYEEVSGGLTAEEMADIMLEALLDTYAWEDV